MSLLRDGIVIEPVRQYKIEVGRLDTPLVDAFDVAYAGMNQYHPAVFDTASRYRLRVLRSTDGGKAIEFDISKGDIKRICDQFAGFLGRAASAK